MAKIKHGLIMAAGRGQRMMPLTNELPKAMAIYEDSTLVARGIARMKAYLPYIHITVGYKGAILAKHAIEHNVSSTFNTEGKGNAWWVYNTLIKHLDEPIFVFTCDNVTDLDFKLLEKDYFKNKEPACMIVPVAPIEGLEGDFIFHNNYIITELNRHKPSNIYCSGIQILNPAKINRLTTSVDDFYGVWKQLIGLKQLYCSKVYPKNWFTVDNLQQLSHIKNMSVKGGK